MSEGVKQTERFMYRSASQLHMYKDVSPPPRLVNVRVGKQLFCLGEFRRKIATRSWPAPVPVLKKE